ncbi:hypothetical protein [Pyrolobus fumarii]|nr:hypothetical protein [Pyrolobus fumarii]
MEVLRSLRCYVERLGLVAGKEEGGGLECIGRPLGAAAMRGDEASFD